MSFLKKEQTNITRKSSTKIWIWSNLYDILAYDCDPNCCPWLKFIRPEIFVLLMLAHNFVCSKRLADFTQIKVHLKFSTRSLTLLKNFLNLSQIVQLLKKYKSMNQKAYEQKYLVEWTLVFV